MNREIVILHKNIDISKTILSKIKNEKITIFSEKELDNKLKEEYSTYTSNIKYEIYPENINTDAKQRNYINKLYKETYKFKGYLHVIQSNIIINNDPYVFFENIENMMNVLDYSVWFNTVTDPFNYVYNKYVPRITFKLDIPGTEKLGIGQNINITSHSNINYVIYDFNKVTDDLLLFNDNFKIPMFYIIEFLARRRNTKTSDSLYCMNAYLTVNSERGLFSINNNVNLLDEPLTKEIQESENAYYISLKVDNHPDNNIDQLLENTIIKLRKFI